VPTGPVASPAMTTSRSGSARDDDGGGKPHVYVPPGETPPADLVIEDVVDGEGPTVEVGSEVAVHYVGAAWSTRKPFDASWDRGETFGFTVGSGQVIKGWDQGVVGMRVGGRRRITIPPNLAYGKAGAGGVIRPGETLVFVVDLIEIR
jgi:peptidylprolyl isomerase